MIHSAKIVTKRTEFIAWSWAQNSVARVIENRTRGKVQNQVQN